MNDSGADCEVLEKGPEGLLSLGEAKDAGDSGLKGRQPSAVARIFLDCHALWCTCYHRLWTARRVVVAIVLIVSSVTFWVTSNLTVIQGDSSEAFSYLPSSSVISSAAWSNSARTQPFFRPLYKKKFASTAEYPTYLESAMPTDFCSICDCQASPSYYAPSTELGATSGFPPRPRQIDIHPTSNTIDVNEFIRLAILDIYCARQHLTNQQGLTLVRRTATHINEMMSWSLARLSVGMPTIYMTTVTSPNGKAGSTRPQYFRRHGRAIRSWMAQQEHRILQSKTEWGPKAAEWQVVWVVAEDETELDPLVLRTLQRTGVPFIYFAYGRTKSWGNAQKNAVLQMVYALSRQSGAGIYGHGPVYGLDDDNKILPELLDRITRLERIGVLPVGNLLGGWESPSVDEDLGEVVGAANLLGSFDYGGLAFNSSLLGTAISGPSFWKWTDFAREGELMAQFTSNVRDLEPLCGKPKQQDCHLVWHTRR